eukprot:6307097-Lingulodinium_polyedra.AAC.1
MLAHAAKGSSALSSGCGTRLSHEMDAAAWGWPKKVGGAASACGSSATKYAKGRACRMGP